MRRTRAFLLLLLAVVWTVTGCEGLFGSTPTPTPGDAVAQEDVSSPAPELTITQITTQTAPQDVEGATETDPPPPPADPTATATTVPPITVTVTSAPPTPTDTPTPVPTPCGPPAHWVLYQVRLGDTLFALAIKTGTTVSQIQLANCLPGDLILAGQPLWLPFIPPPPAVQVNTGSAEPPPPGDPKIEFTPLIAAAGQIIQFTLTEFEAQEQVTIMLINVETTAVTTIITTVDEEGDRTLPFGTAGLDPGPYQVIAEGNIASFP